MVIENENWRLVSEGYEISDCGRLRSIDRFVINSRSLTPYWKKGRVLKHFINRGYATASLCVNQKYISVKLHRLVAIAFIPNTEDKSSVNHKNGIKNDNRVENLEWCTTSENNLHAFRVLKRSNPLKDKKNELSHRSKVVRCSTLNHVFCSVTEASNMLDCDASTIIKVCNSILVSTKGFCFKWV